MSGTPVPFTESEWIGATPRARLSALSGSQSPGICCLACAESTTFGESTHWEPSSPEPPSPDLRFPTPKKAWPLHSTGRGYRQLSEHLVHPLFWVTG